MIKNYKPSQFNLYLYDENTDLFIYNFLEGPSKVIRINTEDIEKCKYLFYDDNYCTEEEQIEYQELTNILYSAGVLVNDDIDEYINYEERHYIESFNRNLHLTILPTGNCMFKCPYCYEAGQDFYRNRMSEESRDLLLKYVQRAIVSCSSLEIGWYGGEPLMELGTIKYLSSMFIKMCNSRHIPYVAEMTTNAYLLNPEVFDQLYKLRVYTYMITLDGLKEQHDQIRCTSDGKGSFDTIVRNLKYIRDNPKYKFASIIVRVNVSKDVYDRIDEVVEFVASEFAHDKRFSITFAAVVQYSEKSDYTKYVDPIEMHKRLFNNDTYMRNLLPSNNRLLQLFPEKKCLASRKNAYVIMPDLGVRKCYSFLEEEKNKVGYIDKTGQLVLDEAKHKKWYLPNRYVQEIPQKCRKCLYLPSCRLANPGCPRRYNLKQNLHKCILDEENAVSILKNIVKYMIETQSCTITKIENIDNYRKKVNTKIES